MKLGILYLNKGHRNGEKVVSEDWVRLASSKQIETGATDAWSANYGYQFWMVGQRPGAFRADGAYGQYSIVLPDRDAVVAIQSSEHNDVARLNELLFRLVLND